ncbi:NAD(P)H-dependent oxidoreductase [Kordiimonas gwangyangensis]|uniref:NAD(P)H-dependent oxidoreductase n=1 Tax=Kordiimonas gwangyangensis TaxID=288022 RepID=UPI000380A3B7|nr:NAD(P)H-dependent oxidoreductase [Kordiimonas gwangyangensis]
MSKLLLLYAHPTPRGSYLNRHLIDAVPANEGVVVRDLYQLYPDFYIDTGEEQRHLVAAETVIMQFPIRWFSVPSILREWQDHVLTKGFAFGHGGHALHGKRFSAIVTTGAQHTSYVPGKPHGAPIETYLEPLMQTARFCGMKPEPAFVVHGARDLSAQARDTARDRYVAHLRSLLTGAPHD